MLIHASDDPFILFVWIATTYSGREQATMEVGVDVPRQQPLITFTIATPQPKALL